MLIPREIRPDPDTRVLHLVWRDGAESAISFDALRDACPCARCKTTREAGREPLRMVLSTRLQSWKRLGNYALHFAWGDSHSDGIFTYALLRELHDAAQAPDA
jgi:DUF971 family protein